MATFGDALNKLWPHGDDRIPGLRAATIQAAPRVFYKYGIPNSVVLAHLMAQISHECGAGLEVVENLNYTAQRICQVWPTRFFSLAAASPYEHNPKALANKVYNGRMGNRLNSNDGWDFRGRGATQTTGRDGYARLAAKTGLDLLNNPDLVNDPRYFLECGVADFILCGCLPYAFKDDIVSVTKKLNGGTIGLTQRKQWLAMWQAEDVRVPPATNVIPLPVPSQTPPDVVPSPKPVPKPAAGGSFWDAIVAVVNAILSIFRSGK